MKKSDYELGTIRILSKNFQPVKKTTKGWSKTKFDTTNILKVIKQFQAHNNLKTLIDTKDPKFLKGFITQDNKIRGARIDVLPNNEKLDKPYSLFAPHLTVHDEKSNTHWDVIYQNPNGKYAYLYTQEKKKQSKQKKFKKVKDFGKYEPALEEKLKTAIKKGELIALPMYTLLKTYMRVGNEIYYKTHGHKGLTTLQKQDINIKNKNVTFSFLAKDGVPQKITKEFPTLYIQKLTKKLAPLKNKEFVFTKNNHPLKDTDFEKAFKKYCGQTFYPHIVRSYYATITTENFIKNNPNPKKEEIKQLFTQIAENLGHKKFSKKKQQWENSYTVTIHHYIQPELVDKLMKFM